MPKPRRIETPPYLVIRDTREKAGWTFPVKAPCLGTVDGTLRTGDYTLKGYEHTFVIERKRSTAEICTNLCEKRFDRELDRLEQFRFPFLVCEFDLEDIINFPVNSGVPEHMWKAIRVTPQFFLKRINEINITYRTKIIFAGHRGREFASSLFKRIAESVEPEPAGGQELG